MAKKIVVKVPTVYLQGGLVSGAEGFPPGTRLDILDYDTDDGNADIICKCRAGDAPHYHNRGMIDADGKY